MNKIKSSWFMYAFIAVPILYFAALFLPYYHSGGSYHPSLMSVFWYPENNEQTLHFLAQFHWEFTNMEFRPQPVIQFNILIAPLLTTQLVGIFLIIFSLILKGNGVVAFMAGAWGTFGLISFLTTPSLTFSRVLVNGGFASFVILFIFLIAIALCVLFFVQVYLNYKKTLEIARSVLPNQELSQS